MDTSVDLEREALFESMVKAIAIEACEGLACEVFLFGSRARGRIRRSSDFDIGIRGLSAEQFRSVRRKIEDEVEESRVPHAVDVVDFDRADERFRTLALQGIAVWKND